MEENQIDRLEQSILRLEETVSRQQSEIENLKQMLILQSQQMPIQQVPPIQPAPMQQMSAVPPVQQSSQAQAGGSQQTIRPQVPQGQYRQVPPAMSQQQVPPQQYRQGMPQTVQASPMQMAPMPMAPVQPQPVNPADYGLRAPGQAGREHNYGSMENKIGTSMGIVASILIFVGIVLFVTLVYSSLTDIVKVICIFAFSFAILAAGTIIMRRKVNAFTMSVTGCGMGAVFLSLFVTHIYFGMINRFVLYLMIAAWAGLVYFFFSKKSYVFKLIGQIGITAAVLFGCFSLEYSVNLLDLNTNSWWSQYIFLLAFFIIISAFYLLIKPENTVPKAAPLVVLDYLSITALAATGLNSSHKPAALVFVTILYMFFLLYLYVLTAEKNSTVPTLGIIYLFMSMYTCYVSFDIIYVLDLPKESAGLFALHILVLASAFAAEIIRGRRKPDNDAIHIIMTVVLYVFLLNKTAMFEPLYNIMGLGIYIFPMLAAAYCFKDKTALSLSYVTMFLFVFFCGEYLTINIIAAVLAAAVSGVLLYRDKKMYSQYFKCIWYLVSLLLIITYFARTADRLDMRLSTNLAWVYIIAALINTVAAHVWLVADWSRKTSEKEKSVQCVCGVLNIILMLIGLIMLDNNYDWPLNMIMLVVVAGVFGNNIKTIYERHKNNPLAGIYTGAKLSIFIYSALHAYSFTGPYVSIGWLVLSIALILSGFKWQYKYLRIYGLFLSMFSIMKLLVFDISYDNPIIRAGSFLVSGGLCFIISLLYNKYNKKEGQSGT